MGALSHPRILSIFDLSAHEGTSYDRWITYTETAAEGDIWLASFE